MRLTSAAAAIGASLCCVVPLVLVSLGISGAWLASLTALEPYRPLFAMAPLTGELEKREAFVVAHFSPRLGT
jgi:mercuric ion transport protein